MDSTIQHKKIEEAVGRYELIMRKTQRRTAEPVKLITISRQIGAGGREIAEILCEKLGCLIWGREILDVLAGQSGGSYQARMFRALDESTQGAIDEVVSDFFGRVGRHTYHYLLPRAILAIAQSDAVILGRGANLLLPQAFHVRITASPEKRVQAIMARESVSRKEAQERVRKTDRQRDKFLREFAGSIRARGFRDGYDVILSTDRLSTGDCAAMILQGFEIFSASRESAQELRKAV